MFGLLDVPFAGTVPPCMTFLVNGKETSVMWLDITRVDSPAKQYVADKPCKSSRCCECKSQRYELS